MEPGSIALDDTYDVEDITPDAGEDFVTFEVLYDPPDLIPEGILEESLRLYVYDEIGETWGLAGRHSNTNSASGSFVMGAPTSVLGDWGVDTINDRVWANIDHASSYVVGGIVPEPGTSALLILGAAAVLRRRAR